MIAIMPAIGLANLWTIGIWSQQTYDPGKNGGELTSSHVKTAKNRRFGVIFKENWKYSHIYRVLGQTLLVASQFGVADYDKSIFGVIGGDPTALNGRKVQKSS